MELDKALEFAVILAWEELDESPRVMLRAG